MVVNGEPIEVRSPVSVGSIEERIATLVSDKRVLIGQWTSSRSGGILWIAPLALGEAGSEARRLAHHRAAPSGRPIVPTEGRR